MMAYHPGRSEPGLTQLQRIENLIPDLTQRLARGRVSAGRGPPANMRYS